LHHAGSFGLRVQKWVDGVCETLAQLRVLGTKPIFFAAEIESLERFSPKVSFAPKKPTSLWWRAFALGRVVAISTRCCRIRRSAGSE
jgi:hypothetical protein